MLCSTVLYVCLFFFQEEDGIRFLVRSGGLGEVYKRQEWNLLMAAATAMTVPVVMLFFFAQRYFVEGLVLSGLKG